MLSTSPPGQPSAPTSERSGRGSAGPGPPNVVLNERYQEPEHSWADGIIVFLALTEEPGRDQAQSPRDLATELDEQFDRVVLAVPGDRS